MATHLKDLHSQEAILANTPRQVAQWSPYQDNGGTVIGLRGKGYAIIGGDTRLSDGGYAIQTRYSTKTHQLTNHCTIASAGQQSERTFLWKSLDNHVEQYEFKNEKAMPPGAIVQTLSKTLYERRFFPIYTFNVVAGVDKETGQGYIWGYDAVGSFESSPYCVCGSGSALITSILDNQIEFKTQPQNKRDLTLEEALTLFKDSFLCAGERDIYTGDSVDYAVITPEGTTLHSFKLKID